MRRCIAGQSVRDVSKVRCALMLKVLGILRLGPAAQRHIHVFLTHSNTNRAFAVLVLPPDDRQHLPIATGLIVVRP